MKSLTKSPRCLISNDRSKNLIKFNIISSFSIYFSKLGFLFKFNNKYYNSCQHKTGIGILSRLLRNAVQVGSA